MKYTETSYQTKKRLADALADMLAVKSFNKITVGDLVTVCGVNRKTFYYHFDDIQALMRWMFREELAGLIDPYSMQSNYTALAHCVMDYVEEHESMFFHIIGTVGEDALSRTMYDGLYGLQNAVVVSYETHYGTRFDETFRDFLLKFMTGALVGVLKDWICARNYHSREDTLEYLREIFRITIPGLIEQGLHLEEKK